MSAFQTYLHTTIFLNRTIFTTIFRRMFGMKSKMSRWNAAEEIIMRTLRFAAKLGDVHVPNTFISVLSSSQRLVVPPVFGLHIEDLTPEQIGFGIGSSGRKKFGNINCTAQWITLDDDLPFGS